MIPETGGRPMPTPEELASLLGNYLELVKNHSKELGWLLEQHSDLRSEYVTFFKKDLKEIEACLQGLESSGEKAGKASGELLQSVVITFRQDLERSYDLLNFTFFWKLAQMVESGGSGYEQLS